MAGFLQSQMQYDDGTYYKWDAKADHDNPYYTAGTDHSELNRTEGYEILYFINHIGNKRWNGQQDLSVYRKIETMIKNKVPLTIKTHKKIEDWIIANWSN